MPFSCHSEGLLVVAVERFERGHQLQRQRQGIERLALAAPFFGMSLRTCSQRLRNIGARRPGCSRRLARAAA